MIDRAVAADTSNLAACQCHTFKWTYTQIGTDWIALDISLEYIWLKAVMVRLKIEPISLWCDRTLWREPSASVNRRFVMISEQYWNKQYEKMAPVIQLVPSNLICTEFIHFIWKEHKSHFSVLIFSVTSM